MATAKVPTPEKNDFDKAAEVAEKELDTFPVASIKVVATWWMKHYMSAGHKRLGRLLVVRARKNGW